MAYGHRREKLRKSDSVGADEHAHAKKQESLKHKIKKMNAPKTVSPIDTSFALKLRGETRTVKTRLLQKNAWNPNSMAPFTLDKLRQGIRTVGFIDPILVRSGDDKGPFPDGRLEIIDGEHRWIAAQEEKLKRVMVHDIGNVADATAKVLTLTMNDLRGRHDRDAVAVIVSELSKLGNGAELTDLLPYDEAELDSLRSLGASDLDILDTLPPEESDRTPGHTEDDSEDHIEDILELDRIKPRRAAEIAGWLEGFRDYLADNTPEGVSIDRPGSILEALMKAAEAHYDITPVAPEEKSAKRKKSED